MMQNNSLTSTVNTWRARINSQNRLLCSKTRQPMLITFNNISSARSWHLLKPNFPQKQTLSRVKICHKQNHTLENFRLNNIPNNFWNVLLLAPCCAFDRAMINSAANTNFILCTLYRLQQIPKHLQQLLRFLKTFSNSKQPIITLTINLIKYI